MFGIGHFPELIIVLVIALVVFGPGKLPEIGRSLGKGIRGFRDATRELEQTFSGTFEEPLTPVQPAQPVAGPGTTPVTTPEATAAMHAAGGAAVPVGTSVVAPEPPPVHHQELVAPSVVSSTAPVSEQPAHSAAASAPAAHSDAAPAPVHTASHS